MVGPQNQDFWPRSTYVLKGYFFTSVGELGFVKKCQSGTFEVNFQCKNELNFFKKKRNILNNNLGDFFW